MNTVSFGSTFRLKGYQDFDKETKVMNFCDRNGLEYRSKIVVVEPAVKNSIDCPLYDIQTRIIAPDDKDKLVQTYLASKGVKFKKIDRKDLLDKAKIEQRINDAPKGKQLVKVDVKKLDELILNQDNNIVFCEDDYNKYYDDTVRSIIESGDKITPTTLYIKPTGESVEDTIDYIHRYGSDRLNQEQLLFAFSQRTDDPDHCVFFGLKKLGMDKVPVYVDKDTYKIGSALGIFEQK